MCILMPITAKLNDVVVAHFFSSRFEQTREPPQQRLEKEDGRGNLTEQVPVAVPTPEMGHFVDEHFADGETMADLGEQHRRSTNTCQARTRQARAAKNLRSGYAQPGRELVTDADSVCISSHRLTTQSTKPRPGCHKSYRQ